MTTSGHMNVAPSECNICCKCCLKQYNYYYIVANTDVSDLYKTLKRISIDNIYLRNIHGLRPRDKIKFDYGLV